MGWGVWPTPQNRYPIYDQNLWYSRTLFMTWPNIQRPTYYHHNLHSCSKDNLHVWRAFDVKTSSFHHFVCWWKATSSLCCKLGFLNSHEECLCMNHNDQFAMMMSCSKGLARDCHLMEFKVKASRSRKIWVCRVSSQTVWNESGHKSAKFYMYFSLQVSPKRGVCFLYNLSSVSSNLFLP